MRLQLINGSDGSKGKAKDLSIEAKAKDMNIKARPRTPITD